MTLNTFFIIYQIIHILGFPLILVYLFTRPVRGKPTFGNFIQRMGFLPKVSNNKKTIWLHAVSVGEILSIQSLVRDIKKIPDTICYITTGTVTGKDMALKKLDADYVSLISFDFLPAMILAFKRINPRSIIIVEAELWPNLLCLANFKKIPTYAINARMSQRSFRRYKVFKRFLSPLLNTFKKLYVQTKDDESRYKNLGASRNKISPLGNLKTLNVLEKVDHEKALPVKTIYPTILVGSVHPGELEIYLKLFKTLKKEVFNLKLILAPRHFHWKNALVKKINEYDLKFELWDEKHTSNNDATSAQQSLHKNDLLLVCKLGTLFDLYQISTIFCLGGTFVKIGGHNLLEPAVWSKVSLIGPYYQNCKMIADQLEEVNGLIKTNNEKELIRKVRYLIKNPEITQSMEFNAASWLKSEAQNVKIQLADLLNELKEI
ncbi:hypothetical protein KAW80_03570 [Candidatus Babeliales bacterium]|nr:hypothetical protein [Candidatus Babeliales bacterium]